ncbi:MAG: TldD/PmbA family protein [Myxococcota bacterium]|jgi:TldD protein|nr:TldD/PmbA family protein [Myxococcota bacterium]
MRALLEDIAAESDGFVEFRYHHRSRQTLDVSKGRLENSSAMHRTGVGVRVLEDGTWGFSSTNMLDRDAIRSAVDRARRAAKASAPHRSSRIERLAQERLARGEFEEPGVDEVLNRPVEEKIALAMETESTARAASSQVPSARCRYDEIYEDKIVVTTDGASVRSRLVRPQLVVQAVAEAQGERSSHAETIGVTGGWDCLFRTGPSQMAEKAARTAVDLLSAGFPDGGRTTVILAPSIVGLLVHEAIGHTVEADFVLSGSVAAGKLGQRVGSELVTLCDAGASAYAAGAAGTLPVDDEGVLTQETVIIDQGILNSYLHNRETAAHFGVEPTGNARAWEYADQPLIRMRNTFLRPGDQTLEEIIASTPNGLLLDGPRNGQADATGEFTFGVSRATRIRDGKPCELLRGVTITGIAFEVLQTVDAVSREFRWDMGAGYCGKGQPAKVDAGGPFIRCQALVGGR